MSDGNVAADQLRLFIERIERLEEEKRGMMDDIKDVFLEAKSQGYDPKAMRAVIRLRKMEKNARDEAPSDARNVQSCAGSLMPASSQEQNNSSGGGTAHMVNDSSPILANVISSTVSLAGRNPWFSRAVSMVNPWKWPCYQISTLAGGLETSDNLKCRGQGADTRSRTDLGFPAEIGNLPLVPGVRAAPPSASLAKRAREKVRSLSLGGVAGRPYHHRFRSPAPKYFTRGLGAC